MDAEPWGFYIVDWRDTYVRELTNEFGVRQ